MLHTRCGQDIVRNQTSFKFGHNPQHPLSILMRSGSLPLRCVVTQTRFLFAEDDQVNSRVVSDDFVGVAKKVLPFH